MEHTIPLPRTQRYFLFLALPIALILISLAGYTIWHQMMEQTAKVARTRQAVNTSESLRSYLVIAEISQRSYLTHGDHSALYPQPFHADSLMSQLDQLQLLVGTSAALQKPLAIFKQQLQDRHHLVLEIIHGRRPSNQALQDNLQKAQGSLENILRTIQKLLEHQTQTALTISTRTKYGMTLLILVYTLAIVFLGLLFRRQLIQTRICEKELKILTEELYLSFDELVASSEKLATYNDHLESSIEELNKLAQEKTGLQEEISEQKEAENRLRLRIEELDTQNKVVDNFTYSVSYDLRDSILSALGLSHLISSEENTETVREYCALIEQRIRKVDRYIQTILDDIWSLQAKAEISRIDFNHMLRNCLDEISYLPHSDRLNITSQIENESEFYSDPVRLGIIFKNILSNAIKYLNPQLPHSCLRISIRTNAHQASIGIDPESLDRIFEKFYRVHSHQTDGCGLGLFIARQTVVMLGGHVAVTSTPQVGTNYILTMANLRPEMSYFPNSGQTPSQSAG